MKTNKISIRVVDQKRYQEKRLTKKYILKTRKK